MGVDDHFLTYNTSPDIRVLVDGPGHLLAHDYDGTPYGTVEVWSCLTCGALTDEVERHAAWHDDLATALARSAPDTGAA